ncbi:MAG: hypothetical protein ABFD89_20560 [Bryobacteraceae bacterium]
MGKSTTTSNNVLNLIFSATAWANIAANAASSPATNLYVALHTADPGAGGTQSTNEVTYTSYARVAVARSGSGWTTSTVASVSPQAAIIFPAGTGGSGTATYASIGMLSSGAGIILYSGPISPSIVTGNGVTPQLSTASTISES